MGKWGKAEVPKRILIVRTDRMGDVILSTPVIRALREAFPNAFLAMMVRPEYRSLIEGHPDLDAVIPYDKDGSERGWLGNWRFIQRLRRYELDTAVILHSTNRVILIAWMAGISRRIGYARRLPWLLTHRLAYVKKYGDRHEWEYNLDLLKLLGIVPRPHPIFVPVDPVAKGRVEAFLRGQGMVPDRPLVAIHPGASCPSKRWPADRFAAVADRLIERYRVQVVVVTGPDQREVGQSVLRKMRHWAIPAFGTLALPDLAALFQKSRCLISNDSGPVHLAAAVGTPVVAIFGRWGGGLSAVRWGPVGNHHQVLHRDVGCRPCLAHRCPIGFLCLEAISVEEVVAAAKRWVSEDQSIR